ncbi:MAG: hypothetical protein JO272_08575 [Pseudonocardiales bacterium]|nr:hypothetical protein [Pseudonocardiales bacterium]
MHALSDRTAKRARRQAPRCSLSVPPGVTEVTEARTGTVHLVSEQELAPGERSMTLCGREVLQASWGALQRRSCSCCVAWFVAWRYRLVDLPPVVG